MNLVNENQHWISRHLLRRFKNESNPLQCYQTETGGWIEKSIDRICSARGYNQLLVSGEVENSLEAEFSKCESKLPSVLRELDAAARVPTFELSQSAYENLCKYCAFLKGIGPYSKVDAVLIFLHQLNMDLDEKNNPLKGTSDLIRELNIPQETIHEWRRQHKMGLRVIVESENLLQLLYRLKFVRSLQFDLIDFQNTRWKVLNSPLELPMSDVGLVRMFLNDLKAHQFLLPLGANILLHGVLFYGPDKISSSRTIRGISLTKDEAGYIFDCICLSAINEVICARRLPGVSEARARAEANGVRFCKIVDLLKVKRSGLLDVGAGQLKYRMVSIEEYVQVIRSYATP